MVLTIQWNDLSDYENGQEQLQRLHYLQDRVFLVSPRLRATLEIVFILEALEHVDLSIEVEGRSQSVHYRRQFLYELKIYKTLIGGLLESAGSLERRMQGILTMVRSRALNSSTSPDSETNFSLNKKLSAALNLRHQATGVDISGGVLKLTTEIVSDSTTVRVITFVTLLYMPATFIAVSRVPLLLLLSQLGNLIYVDSAWNQFVYVFPVGIGCWLPSLASILDIRRSGNTTHACNHWELVFLQSAYQRNKIGARKSSESQQAVGDWYKVV